MPEPVADPEILPGRASVVVGAEAGAGWWPPGSGDPGTDWEYEPADLKLLWADDGDLAIDVLIPTPEGDRAIASVPLAGIAVLLSQAFAVEKT